MRRRKRHIFGWVALGLAVAAIVPALAQAEPRPSHDSYQAAQQMELGLSEGKIRALGLVEQGTSPDDRSVSRAQVVQPMELGLSQGKIRALGLEQSATKSPDDRSYSWATNVDLNPVVSHDARSIDVNAYTVTGFGLALFIAMAIGMGLVAVRHRGTKLSPA